MSFLSKKFNFLIFLFSIFLLLSCSPKSNKNFFNKLEKNSMKIESINLNDLMLRLSKADEKLTPKLVNKIDGSSYYSYIKRPGESDINLKEIKKRITLGSDFYKNDRKKILTLLKRINELKINNKLANIGNETLGLWVPTQELIIINDRTINMGSPTFLNVLRHEVIHVSQSCNSGNREDFPKRIGLPLEFSKNINLNLHNFYSQNPEEVINIEREAFTYSKIDGAAIKLLNKFCK